MKRAWSLPPMDRCWPGADQAWSVAPSPVGSPRQILCGDASAPLQRLQNPSPASAAESPVDMASAGGSPDATERVVNFNIPKVEIIKPTGSAAASPMQGSRSLRAPGDGAGVTLLSPPTSPYLTPRTAAVRRVSIKRVTGPVGTRRVGRTQTMRSQASMAPSNRVGQNWRVRWVLRSSGLQPAEAQKTLETAVALRRRLMFADVRGGSRMRSASAEIIRADIGTASAPVAASGKGHKFSPERRRKVTSQDTALNSDDSEITSEGSEYSGDEQWASQGGSPQRRAGSTEDGEDLCRATAAQVAARNLLRQALDADAAAEEKPKQESKSTKPRPGKLAIPGLKKGEDPAAAHFGADLLRAALRESWAAGLNCSDPLVAQAEGRLHEELQARKGVADGLGQLAKEAAEVTEQKGMDALRELRSRLNKALQEARACNVPEELLHDAERQRRRVHNMIEDLKGQNRVVCRVRPLNEKEVNKGEASAITLVDDMTLEVPKGTFSFDGIYAPGTQEEVFNDCRDLVQSAVDGHNVTIFTYGHTGTGKTYTMLGTPTDKGIAARTIEEIFAVTDKMRLRNTVTISATMVELYNNQLSDLGRSGSKRSTLNSPRPSPVSSPRIVGGASTWGRQTSPRTSALGAGAQHLEGLHEVEAFSPVDLHQMLATGVSHRVVADNMQNSESSRSHMLFTIKVRIEPKEGTAEPITSCITLCDLGGCERLHPDAAAEQRKEAIEINRSLSALVDVIEAICKHYKQIPFRNHKLTQLLQDSLGGTAKTLMIATLSPAASAEHDTHMALKYAGRLKSIIAGAAMKPHASTSASHSRHKEELESPRPSPRPSPSLPTRN